MSLTSNLETLIDELDRFHGGATPWTEESFPLAYITAESGAQRCFTKKAMEALFLIAENIFNNRYKKSTKIAQEDFTKIVRQAVADMHAADEFNGSDEKTIKRRLYERIDAQIAKMAPEYTHHFPVWTLGMEKEAPFTLGPVTFYTPLDWIDSINFTQCDEWHLSR